jgi:hypothetical protein
VKEARAHAANIAKLPDLLRREFRDFAQVRAKYPKLPRMARSGPYSMIGMEAVLLLRRHAGRYGFIDSFKNAQEQIAAIHPDRGVIAAVLYLDADEAAGIPLRQ